MGPFKSIILAAFVIGAAMATWILAPIFGAIFGVGLAIWVLAEMINADEEEKQDESK
jgi:hypothetical protein